MERNTTQHQPATTNQIEVERPNVKKSTNVLPGEIAGSLNGGHYKVMAYIPVMQGQEAHALRGTINFQMLTPKTPAYQKLRYEIIAAFVPHSCVWKNYEEFYAQKGGTSVEKINVMPNLGGQIYPYLHDTEMNSGTYIYNTMAWRDSFISSYIPRPGMKITDNEEVGINQMPAYSALALRGWPVIWNQLLRNKEYDFEIPTFNGNTITAEEMETYIPINTEWLDYYFARAKRDNSYYTNYRTELQGFEAPYPPNDMSADGSLIQWMKWEQDYASAKKQAEDSMKTAWSILAEERGAKVALQGKPQIIGRKIFNLNYSSITQNAYNNNENIEDKYRVMGFQGAYSYTNIDMPLFENVTFEEDGIVHLIGVCTAETVFSTGLNRQMLNINANEIYRPELAVNTHDVLYKYEMGTAYRSQLEYEDEANKVVGFKRRYSEMFSLPNCINGDMTEEGYYGLKIEDEKINLSAVNTVYQIDSNNTYQFYESNADYYISKTEDYAIHKKLWLDYSDIAINKNLAIPENIKQTDSRLAENEGGVVVMGQNQIFYVGKLQLITTLPIAEEIKNNYQIWGGHE